MIIKDRLKMNTAPKGKQEALVCGLTKQAVPAGCKGFSLMEVLASSIILSIGLLGLASLHFEGMKKGNESFYKSIASIQADDLIDRMRANREGADAGYYNTNNDPLASSNTSCLGGLDNGSRTVNGGGDAEEGEATTTLSTNSSCTTEQIAQQDIYEFKENLAALLPSPEATVCRTSAPGKVGSGVTCDGLGNLYVININWLNKQGTKQTFRVTTKP